MNMDYLLIGLFALISIFIITLPFFAQKIPVIKNILDEFTNIAPALISLGNIIGKNVSKENKSKIENFNTLAAIAVHSVEQISKKENITSEEKLEIALKNFKELSKVANINIGEIEESLIISLIEAAVLKMNEKLK